VSPGTTQLGRSVFKSLPVSVLFIKHQWNEANLCLRPRPKRDDRGQGECYEAKAEAKAEAEAQTGQPGLETLTCLLKVICNGFSQN